MTASSTAARRLPRQERARVLVSAIVETGRRLLESEGSAALTTHRIAEGAGVPIGSLHRRLSGLA